MFFKQNPYLIVVLIVVIIVFAFIGSCQCSNLYPIVEGMESESGDSGDSGDFNELASLAIKCFPNESDIKEIKCFNLPTETDSENDNSESNSNASNFGDSTDPLGRGLVPITSMFPPVCPACPSMIHDHSHAGVPQSAVGDDKNINSNNVITDIDNTETTINNESNETNTNSSTVNTQIINNNAQDDNVKEQFKKYEEQMKKLKGEIRSLKQQELNASSSFKPYSSDQGSNINENESSGVKLSNSENSCTPCPAPQRCPEPAFECKKVINYRSSSVDDYLPRPVLNDFSTF